MMNIRLLSFAFVAVLSPLFLCADTIKSASPVNAATVSLLRPSQRMFIMMDEKTRREVLSDATFATDLYTVERSFPSGVELSWKFNGDRAHCSYEIVLSESKDLANPTIIKAPHSKHRINNLLLGKTYYWKARAIYDDDRAPLETEVRSFTVTDAPPRIMNVPDVDNVRDIGGWTGLEGRKIKQGILYRSSGLNSNSSDGGKTPGKARFNDEGRDVLMNVMKIKTELDLRTLGETASMKVSPLGETVDYINISTTCYGAMFTEYGRANFAQLFKIFTKPENYPIDFHCIAGADRTGSLSYLLLAVLGVSEEDVSLDYVLTSFFALRGYNNADIFAKGFGEYGAKDEPLYSKAERYLLSAGITPQEIVAFREIALGPGLQLTPALKEHLAIEEQMAIFSNPLPEGCSIEQVFAIEEKFEQAGKAVQHRLPPWPAKFVRKAGSRKDGAVAFYLVNAGKYPAMARINPPGKGDFIVGDLIKSENYNESSGSFQWSAAAFKGERNFFTLMPGEQRILAVIPSDSKDRPSFKTGTSLRHAPPSAMKLLTAKSSQPPKIDGMLDDAAWLNAEEYPLCALNGDALQNPPIARFATDKEHGTLFISVVMPDKTPLGSKHAERDGALWNEDSCEIFISHSGHSTYYQLIINAYGDIYDSKGTDGSWNLKDYTVAAKRGEDVWAMELALPLAQFNFADAIEINVCGSDLPHNKLVNLSPTNGTFHNRSVMLPVVLK